MGQGLTAYHSYYLAIHIDFLMEHGGKHFMVELRLQTMKADIGRAIGYGLLYSPNHLWTESGEKRYCRAFDRAKISKETCKNIETADAMALIVSTVRLVWNMKIDEMKEFERLLNDEETHASEGFLRAVPPSKGKIRTQDPESKTRDQG